MKTENNYLKLDIRRRVIYLGVRKKKKNTYGHKYLGLKSAIENISITSKRRVPANTSLFVV